MIAEESTAFPKVTMPIHEGGLGFNYKWNMGWMHDSLKYFSMDPIYRKDNHNLLTFLLVYAFSENFILPLSHDEVVHGKKSLLDKMYGSYEEKFATLKAFYGFMMALPGKKLMFMGGEFGQFIEWNFDSQLDWNLLEYDSHRQLKEFVKDLNHVYKENKSLWQLDTSWEGFEWIEANDADNSVISFMRKGKEKKDYLVVVCNFTPVRRVNYSLRVPIPGEYIEVLNSNWEEYGGIQEEGMAYVSDYAKGIEEEEESVIYADLPPLSTVYLRKSKKYKRENFNK